jgi:hypothetical protein
MNEVHEAYVLKGRIETSSSQTPASSFAWRPCPTSALAPIAAAGAGSTGARSN